MKISVRGTAGGVGVTTFAAALALEASKTGPVSVQTDDDMRATFGVMGGDVRDVPPRVQELAPGVWVSPWETDDRDVPFVTTIGAHVPMADADLVVLMFRGPSYTGLRAATMMVTDGMLDGLPTVAVLLAEDGRALGSREVEDCTGVHVLVSVPVLASIARTIDAGVFVSRTPERVASAAAVVMGEAARVAVVV